MSERERLAFLSGAETMAEEIAKAVEQSEYQWAAHYAAFIRALPLLKPDEAALLRASAPPADVAGLITDMRAHAARIDGTDAHAVSAAMLIDGADALAAMAGERDRLREALEPFTRLYQGSCTGRELSDADIARARAALGGSDA